MRIKTAGSFLLLSFVCSSCVFQGTNDSSLSDEMGTSISFLTSSEEKTVSSSPLLSEKENPVELCIATPKKDLAFFQERVEAYLLEKGLSESLQVTYYLEPEGEPGAEDLIADIFIGSDDLLSWKFAKGNQLLKIEGVYARSISEKNDPGSVEAVTMGGFLYGFPFYCSTYTFFYNSSVLSQNDIKDFPSLTKALCDSSKKAFFNPTNNYYMDVLFSPYGAKTRFAIDQSAKPVLLFNNLNSEAGEKGLRDAAALYSSGVYEADILHYDNPDYVAGIAFCEECDEITRNWGENLAFAKIPCVDGEADFPITSCSVQITYSEDAKRNEAALALAEYLSSEDSQSIWCASHRCLPSNKEAQKKATSPFFKALSSQKGNKYPASPYLGAWSYEYEVLIKEASKLGSQATSEDLRKLLEVYSENIAKIS